MDITATPHGLPAKIPVRRKPLSMRLKRFAPLYVMLAPSLAVVLLTKYGPMFGLYMAFTNFQITAQGFLQSFFGAEFVGLRWFRQFVAIGDFVKIMRNTLATSVISLVFTFPAPIIIALAVNEVASRPFKRVVQTVSYLPYFISWVIVANIFTTLLSGGGVVNDLLRALGLIDKPILFFQQGRLFWWIVAAANVWKSMGYNAILYLAAISSIPQEQYESAKVDGANRLRQILHITLPALKSTVVVLLIFAISGIMNAGFDQQMLMQNDTIRAYSDVIDTYVYRYGVSIMMFSYAAAVGLFKSVVSFVLLLGANGISRRLTDQSVF